MQNNPFGQLTQVGQNAGVPASSKNTKPKSKKKGKSAKSFPKKAGKQNVQETSPAGRTFSDILSSQKSSK